MEGDGHWIFQKGRVPKANSLCKVSIGTCTSRGVGKDMNIFSGTTQHCWVYMLKFSLEILLISKFPQTWSQFCRLKSLGVFLLTLGWDASPSQAYLQHWICWYPFTHVPGWTEALWNLSVLPKNTTQCPRPGLTMGLIDPKTSALTRRTNNRASNLWSKWTPWSSLGVHGKGS